MEYTDDESKKINKLIDKLRRSDYDFKDSVADRLLSLAFPPNEDVDEDWPKISILSLESLVYFFTNKESKNIVPRRPSIILCDGGDLRAEWKCGSSGGTDFLGLRFMSKNKYKCVCFYSDTCNLSDGMPIKRFNRVAECEVGLKQLFEITWFLDWI